MAEEYLMVKPEEFQQLIQYYKGQITDSALLNKAGRVAAKEHIIVNNPKVPDAQTREMFQERRQLTKRLRDIPSVLTADLADVESEESAMTEKIVEHLLKCKARVRFFTLHQVPTSTIIQSKSTYFTARLTLFGKISVIFGTVRYKLSYVIILVQFTDH